MNSYEAVKQSITHRIARQHVDVLVKYGPEKVLEAIEEESMYKGDLEEIGSSDISCWVRNVIESLERQAQRAESIRVECERPMPYGC